LRSETFRGAPASNNAAGIYQAARSILLNILRMDRAFCFSESVVICSCGRSILGYRLLGCGFVPAPIGEGCYTFAYNLAGAAHTAKSLRN
jgi:hypothetical protein